MTQLALFLDEHGENAESIKQLQQEVKQGYSPPFVPYQKPRPIDPWPPHMRSD